MDNEMIERLVKTMDNLVVDDKLSKFDTIVGLVKAMRQPTEKMKLAGALIDAGQSGKYSYDEIYQIMINTITGDE